jgi:hypothetical protein
MTCLLALQVYAASPSSEDGRPYGDLPIKVVNPSNLPPGDIPAVRTPLGIPDDYKPWIVQLKNRELLIVAFDQEKIPLPSGNRFSERAVFWRSKDGGRTWGPREERKDLPGREFSLNRMPDGTLLMPCMLLADDIANQDRHHYSMLYRSANEGKTWTRERIGPEGFPPRGETVSDWSIIEAPDSAKPGRRMIMMGVSIQNGGRRASDYAYLWRSWNNGKTWDKSLIPDTANWYDVDGFFSQSVTYCTRVGKLLHTTRVDATGPHWRIPGAELKQQSGDNGDRTMLWDSTNGGLTWRRHRGNGVFGTYGEMYPRFLRLRDDRLLLTFTVRSNPTDGYPLGLRAVFSQNDGETWNFGHDRLIISYVNEGASGGGFGNTIQLADEMLVSVYSYRGKDGKTHVEAVRWSVPSNK